MLCSAVLQLCMLGWAALGMLCCADRCCADLLTHAVLFCALSRSYVSSRLFRTSFWWEVGKFLLVFGIVGLMSIMAAVGQVSTCPLDPAAAALIPDAPAPGAPSGACVAWRILDRVSQIAGIACAVLWALHIGGPHRTRVRKLLGISDSRAGGDCCTCCHMGPNKGSASDCCLHFWCLCCALAQEMRTVMHYEAVKKQQQGLAPEGYEPLITRAPVVGRGMSRTPVVGVPVASQGDALV